MNLYDMVTILQKKQEDIQKYAEQMGMTPEQYLAKAIDEYVNKRYTINEVVSTEGLNSRQALYYRFNNGLKKTQEVAGGTVFIKHVDLVDYKNKHK